MIRASRILLLGASVFAYGALDNNSARALGEYYQRNLRLDDARKVWNHLLESSSVSASDVIPFAKLVLYQEGRSAALRLLQTMKQQKLFTREDGALITQCEREISRVFVTDDGQALYLRAKNRIENKDYQPAIDFLYQALRLEGSHALIYEDLIRASYLAGQRSKMSNILKSAYDLDPLNDYVADRFFEMKLNDHDYVTVIDEVKGRPKATVRQRISLAFSLSESGKLRDSYLTLQSILVEEKNRAKSMHPVVWFLMGKYLGQSYKTQSEASVLLKRFVNSFQSADLFLVEGSDPYPSQEKLAEAKDLIASLARESFPE